jgi:hypothetical protein
MSMRAWQGRLMWAGGAVLALLAIVYAGPARDVVQPRGAASPAPAEPHDRAEPQPSVSAPAVVNDPDLARARERLQSRERPEPIRDAFAPRSWAPAQVEPPPAPAQAAPPPPAPVAPPLPFRYLGQLSEQGRTVVFLARGEAPVAGSVGEVLDGTYRIERIADTAVEFTYLPLNERQVLQVGGVQ